MARGAAFGGLPAQLASDPSALRKAIYKTRAVVLPRKVVVTREFLDFAPLLKAVARMHASADNTDLEACPRPQGPRDPGHHFQHPGQRRIPARGHDAAVSAGHRLRGGR